MIETSTSICEVIAKLRIAREAPYYGREYAFGELWNALDRLDDREADDESR
ncbi:hypothetical protein LCGC14_1815330 [marine sediment metagenome]|uniref:Uncharacterized protein n=1 Tax=marine sediment metagenome TaxID=412755 RepID=A0A0F9GKM9_9ZZZZ